MPDSEPEVVTQADLDAARDWIWVTHDGTRMALGDMAQSHLRNLQPYAQKRLDLHEKAHDDTFLWHLDDKNRSSFSGHEDSIEHMTEAVRMISLELERRKTAGSEKQKTPA